MTLDCILVLEYHILVLLIRVQIQPFQTGKREMLAISGTIFTLNYLTP